MRTLISWMDETWYPKFEDHWDDRMLRERILRLLTPESVVLDLGAGAGIVKQMDFRGLARKVCGVDLDPRVLKNPLLDEGRIGNAGVIPYADGQFDLAFSDNLLEHLDTPCAVFSEVTRVLKPGGVFLFKTPNKWHYMPTIARLTPFRFHQYVNRLRGRAQSDTFPTRYRANTKRAVIRLAENAGLMVERIERIEGRPEYLRMTELTYLVGAAYERLVNTMEVLAPFRILLMGTLRKLGT
jgi:SAM-dependent methyltransferase